MDATWTILNLLGALGVFLFGMKIMSEGLQKVAGSRLKRLLGKITANRFSGVATGFGITSIVQSSSATTVLVVSFVNAGLITLVQSIGVIMGANIGTTVTGWLVALLGFKIKITLFALPAVGLGVLMSFLKGARVRQWGEVLVGFGLLFLGLALMKDSVPDLSGDQLGWVETISQWGFGTTVLFVAVGTALTVILQSSSATMTLTLTLTATGLIPYEAAAAMILGENVGTTVTANLASIGTSAAARRAARAHLLFNLFGVAWALVALRWVLLPFVDIVIPGDPTATPSGAGDLVYAGVVTAHLAAFHTTFNISNTLLLLPFVKQIAAIVSRWVADDTKAPVAAKFLSTALVQVPELRLVQARKEMQRMAQLAQRMFQDAMHILAHPGDKLGTLVEDTIQREQQLDDLERAITGVLSATARAATSAKAAREIGEMSLNTHRLERIGDHCEKLVDIAVKNHQSSKEHLDDRAIADIRKLGAIVDESMEQLGKYIVGESTAVEAKVLEDRINDTRDQLRDQYVDRMREGDEEVLPGLWLLDTLHHLEEIGDRCYGIVKRTEETKLL